MRADHDVDLARREPRRDPPALGRGRPVREQRDADRPLGEQRALARHASARRGLAGDGGELLGEHLGRRHERALVAALHRDQQRRDRDHRLARARPRPAAAGASAPGSRGRRGSRRARACWSAGELVRQRRRGTGSSSSPSTWCSMPPRSASIARLRSTSGSWMRRNSSKRSRRCASAPVLRRSRAGARCGTTTCGPGSSFSSARAGRPTAGRRASPAKSSAAATDLLDLPRRDVGLPRLRVDRHDDAGLRVAGAAEHVDDRVRELALAAEEVELPVERDLGADRELALAPRLVEEDEVEQPGLVLDDRLDHLLALPGRARRDALHLGDDRRLLPRRRARRSPPCGCGRGSGAGSAGAGRAPTRSAAS